MPLLTPMASISSLYERAIVDTDKLPELLFFLAFLITFGFIRTSAHMIRAQVSWWPGNVEVGGTHIHHLVWGIVLMMITGYVGVAVQPDAPWAEIIAILFGVGMGLTLDEFALWLTLRDVYWEREGRRSIDAVIIAAALSGLVLVGFKAWVDLADGVENIVFHIVGWTFALAVLVTLINLSKEKFGMAVLGLIVWPIGLIGVFRLGRPGSIWSHYFYSPEKREQARLRFEGLSLKPLPPPLNRRLVARSRAGGEADGAESDQAGAGSDPAGDSGEPPTDSSAGA